VVTVITRERWQHGRGNACRVPCAVLETETVQIWTGVDSPGPPALMNVSTHRAPFLAALSGPMQITQAETERGLARTGVGANIAKAVAA